MLSPTNAWNAWPCLISTFLPCLINLIGPNRTVSTTAPVVLLSPSLPFLGPTQLDLGVSDLQVVQPRSNWPAFPIIPDFSATVTSPNAFAPAFATTTSPTFKLSVKVNTTGSPSEKS